jgi:hypothetical protein
LVVGDTYVGGVSLLGLHPFGGDALRKVGDDIAEVVEFRGQVVDRVHDRGEDGGVDLEEVVVLMASGSVMAMTSLSMVAWLPFEQQGGIALPSMPDRQNSFSQFG